MKITDLVPTDFPFNPLSGIPKTFEYARTTIEEHPVSLPVTLFIVLILADLYNVLVQFRNSVGLVCYLFFSSLIFPL